MNHSRYLIVIAVAVLGAALAPERDAAIALEGHCFVDHLFCAACGGQRPEDRVPELGNRPRTPVVGLEHGGFDLADP